MKENRNAVVRHDGEIFSVGDVIWDSGYKKHVIKSLDSSTVDCSGEGYYCSCSLNSIYKDDSGKEKYFAEKLLCRNGFMLKYTLNDGRKCVLGQTMSFGDKDEPEDDISEIKKAIELLSSIGYVFSYTGKKYNYNNFASAMKYDSNNICDSFRGMFDFLDNNS